MIRVHGGDEECCCGSGGVGGYGIDLGNVCTASVMFLYLLMII